MIKNQKVVTIDYTLKDDQGQLLDSSKDGQFAYLHGAQNIIPGLESALTDRAVGDGFSVTVNPEQGYGLRDDALRQVVPLSVFPNPTEVKVGQQFHAQSPQGDTLVVTVAGLDGDEVTVDGNHPLAGKTLNFDIKVVDVRDATDEELAHGHVHGPGGHDHD